MKNRGFTFLEILVVLAIISILLKFSLSFSRVVIKKDKENELKDNLRKIREAIDRFYDKNRRYPKNLDELVKQHFLRKIPKDPITNSYYRTISSKDDRNTLISDNYDVYDIFSKSKDRAIDGSYYSEW